MLNRFIEQLVVVCNYTVGCSPESFLGRQITIYIESKPELRSYCFEHPRYIMHGKLFAIFYNKGYSNATFLIDPEIFTLNHQVLIVLHQ